MDEAAGITRLDLARCGRCFCYAEQSREAEMTIKKRSRDDTARNEKKLDKVGNMLNRMGRWLVFALVLTSLVGCKCGGGS